MVKRERKRERMVDSEKEGEKEREVEGERGEGRERRREMISNAHQQQVKNLSHFIRSLHKDYFSLPGPLSLSLSLPHFSPWFSVYFIWLLQPYTNKLLGVILRRCLLVSLTTLKKNFFLPTSVGWCVANIWRHDIRHDDTQRNDTQHDRKKWNIILNGIFKVIIGFQNNEWEIYSTMTHNDTQHDSKSATLRSVHFRLSVT